MRLMPVLRRNDPTFWPERSTFPGVFEDLFNDAVQASTLETRSWSPAVDILEKDGNLVLRAELPGMNEKDIDLKLEGNVLTLKGERKFEDEQNRNNYHRVERFYGTFSRSFTLPETVDRDKIKADYKNGVLTVTIPQRPEVRPREIPVAVN